MTTVIAENSIAPIGSDLTAEDNRMRILRGYETMIRKDVATASGVSAATGEWIKLDSAGKAAKTTATPAEQSYLVIAGNDRFDAKATGQVTLCMSRSNVIVKTSLFAAGSYSVGAALTVKLDGGIGKVALQTSTEPKLGRVIEVGNGYIVYEMLGGALS